MTALLVGADHLVSPFLRGSTMRTRQRGGVVMQGP
jgi:hypothetical protein